MSNSSGSAFLELPQELLDRIIQECVNLTSLYNLRLVCHALNDAASVRALQNVQLDSQDVQLTVTAAGLINMGPSAFDTCTTDLTIRAMSWEPSGPGYKLRLYDWEDSVVGVLEKLKCVQTLRYKFTENCGLTPRVIQAIGQLSQLRHLSLLGMECHHLAAPLIAPALTNPDNLRSLQLQWYLSAGTSPASRKQVQAFITACPNLEEISLGRRKCKYSDRNPEFELSDILRDTPVSRPTHSEFRSSVKTFILRSSVKLSASCPLMMRYLSNLTTLAISNIQPEHQALWIAFHQHGIQLVDLTIEVASEPLLAYVLGYQGLKSFRVDQFIRTSRDSPTPSHSQIPKRLLCDGLRHHRGTLQAIIYDGRGSNLGALEAWGTDEDLVVCLKSFAKLTKLGLVILVDENMVPICLNPALRVLTSYLHTVEDVQLHLECSHAALAYTRRSCFGTVMAKANREMISQILGFQLAMQLYHPSWLNLSLNVRCLSRSSWSSDLCIKKDESDRTYRFVA